MMKKRLCLVLAFLLLALGASMGFAKGKSKPASPASEISVPVRMHFAAPPTVPHPLDQGPCLGCHAEGGTGPAVPHEAFPNCAQCHVERNTRISPLVQNSMSSPATPETSSKMHPFAPPTIPHRVFMREKCLACHEKGGSSGAPPSSHPERRNCLQCHQYLGKPK